MSRNPASFDTTRMGDHLALLVDHLLTESTLEAAIKSRKQAQCGTASPLHGHDARQSESSNISGSSEVVSAHKLVECRICQEEDSDLNLEAPCSCSGSLKYAHRKCIQRWCNEKGDTTCEICLQQFKPGYTAPQHLFHYGSLPMNFRGSWEISRQDVQDSQVITMVPSYRDIIGEYDEYSMRTTSSICCQSVAIIFTILLVLRHALPFLIGGAEQYSFALFSLLLLRVAGVIFPLVVIARALTAFHRRRRQQEAREVDTSFDTEADAVQLQSRTIQLH